MHPSPSDPPNLPPMASAETDVDAAAALRPLHPNARYGYHFGYALLALLPLLPTALITRSHDWSSWEVLALVLGLGLVLQLAAFLLARAGFRRTRYVLDAEGLLIVRGVIWRSETRVPRSRVQHTDINRGPIDRWLGLAELKVHTAGTRLAAISLGGLGEDDARRLRNDLLGEDDDAV